MSKVEDDNQWEQATADQWEQSLVNNDGFFNPDELVWYDEESPIYPVATAAQTEAARRFVSHWLNHENQGFIIPNSEWGLSLKHWLHILVAQNSPKE